MHLAKPSMLKPGDRIAAVSLSWGGAGLFPHRYEAGKRQLEAEFDVEVVPTSNALREPEWLERNPRARAEDLHEALLDPSIAGVISMIGGDDSIRLLPFLDPEVIRANPKVFLGYSDSTVTQFAYLAAGVTSFYGPSVLAGFAENGGMFPYMVESVRRTLFASDAPGLIAPNTAGWTVEMLDWAEPVLQNQRRQLRPSEPSRWLQGEGVAEGPLIGGCLEVLDWLRGTEVFPLRDQWDGTVVFLETSEEAPSPEQVTRMLRALAAAGALDRAAALLFGRPGGADLDPADFAAYDSAVLSFVAEELGRPDMPIVTCMDFGHTDPMMVLPMGVRARVDCAARQFSLLESGVSA